MNWFKKLFRKKGKRKPLKNYGDKESSEEFDRAFTFGGGMYRECRCGRIFFADPSQAYDYEPGEYENLVKQAERFPDRYTECIYSICSASIDGKEFVVGCSCNGMRVYEDFIWHHRHSILDYLERCAKEKTSEAERLTAEVDGAKAVEN